MEMIGVGIVLIVVAVAAIFFTRGLFSRDLTQALERVGAQERALQEKADVLEQRLGQVERDYAAKLKRAEAEADRLLREAKEQAMNVRSVAVEESKHRARQLLLEAEHGKAQLRAEIIRELNGAAGKRVCETLRGLLSDEHLSTVHESLVKELLEELKRIDLRAVPVRIDRVAIDTAQSLTSAEQLRLTQWAAASVGSDVPIAIQVDPALVAGAVVRAGQTTIDNSLLNRCSR